MTIASFSIHGVEQSEQMTRLRLRVGLPPREPRPRPEPKAPPRLVEVLHIETDPDGFLTNIVLVEQQDVATTDVLVAAADGADVDPATLHAISGAAPGTVVVPDKVTLAQLGRRLERRCGAAGAALVVFDVAWTTGRASADVHRLRNGSGVSIALPGCGWFHCTTDKYMQSFSRRRFALSNGGGGRVFADWQAPKRRRPGSKKKRRVGGPVIQLDVLGGALGCAVTSPAVLAESLSVEWPTDGTSVDRALALAECYRRLVAELAEVAPGLPPQAVWSAGSIATYVLQRAGMRSPAESLATLPDRMVGAVAAATHGPEATASLLNVPCLMGFVDINRTFLRFFAVCDVTRDLACDHFDWAAEDLAAFDRFRRSPDLRTLLDDRATWEWWARSYFLTEPHSEHLPVHRQAGDRWRSVTAPFDFSGGRAWYHAFDLLAAALTGEYPLLVEGFRIEPTGIAPDHEPARMPSGRDMDLATGTWGLACVEERNLADAIEDPIVRARRSVLAKGFGVGGCWGIFGRSDRHSSPRPVREVDDNGKVRWRHPAIETVCAIGPEGQRLSTETSHPEIAGPLTLQHIAAGIPAGLRLFMAMTMRDLEQIGCTIAATMTDAIVFAMGDADPEVVRQVLARFDALLCPDGGSAWKEECETLTKPTFGLVCGLNEVLLGREEDGRFVLVRSSDTGLGDHFFGTDARLEDGRCVWVAQLQEPLLAHAVATGEVRVPRDLPASADDRPALKPHSASTFEELQWLRDASGLPTLPPFTDFLMLDGHEGRDGPVCLGIDHDPADWRTWDWWANGSPCRIAIIGRGGQLVESNGEGPMFVGHTFRDVLGQWLRERDPTMIGPKAGLRHPAPVRSDPALVELVGRSAEWQDADDGDPLSFGHQHPAPLLDAASALGTAELVARGIPERTAKRIVAGKANPTPATVAIVAAAVAVGTAARVCQAPGCTRPVRGRADKRTCSDACRKAIQRTAPDRFADDACPGCGTFVLAGRCPICVDNEWRAS